MAQSTDQMKQTLTVIIVGAGIAGLAAATALAQKGHSVTVLESKPALNEFGASIGIMCNGVKCLRAWGLTEAFEKVVTKNGICDFRDGLSNEHLGYLPHNKGRYSVTSWGEEVWNINRRDYQETLANAAEACGAHILFDAQPAAIDIDDLTITTVHGKRIEADFIIGADGMKSAVRRAIPELSKIEPRALHEQCFRCTVPKDKMKENPLLEPLLNCGNEIGWMAEGKYVLCWPLPPNRPYDMTVCIERESDVPAGRWGVTADPAEVRHDFQNFCPQVRELLKNMDGCIKWTLAELPPLPTCRSENGKAVVIGDAFHAMIPHSGSGGSSAIEDAACISECLDWAAKNDRDLSEASEAFQDVRKARVERMQTASHEGYGFLGAKGELVKSRNAAIAEQSKHYDTELAIPERERQARTKLEKDMQAKFPSEPYLQWLYRYDAIEETRNHLANLV